MSAIDDNEVGICHQVRTTCRNVMASSRLVGIDSARLDDLAGQYIDLHEPTEWPGGELAPDQESEVTLVLALDAINFGSGYHDAVRKRPGLSGARTMAAALTDYVSFTGPLTGERLRSITATDCSQIFGQELDDGALEELMGRFAVALNDLGALLADCGGAVELIASAERSAERLAESLLAMPFYRDIEQLDGDPVAFYKRAQITPADLCRRFGREFFDDLDVLTAFADNLVPHVLRIDGGITFAPDLVATIDRGERLPSGQRAEIEIRAAGVVAVEELAARLAWRPMDVDLFLWERGGSRRYKEQRRHRSRSTFY